LNILQSIVLGIIQGITEFFPVSSSGHLAIFPYFFSWDYIPLYFTVTVHFATLAAVVTVFYREIYRIIKAVVLGIFIRRTRNLDDFKIGIFIITASIPAAAAGFFLDDYVEGLFSKPLIVAVFLLVTALILWICEIRGARIEVRSGKSPDEISDSSAVSGRKEHKNKSGLVGSIDIAGSGKGRVRFNLFIAAVTGIGQALAIFPGISRSGATISFARFFGIKREDAVKFSFLLSVPVILGSFVFELSRSYSIISAGGQPAVLSLAAGFICAYISGFFAVKFLVYLAGRKNLNVFAVYCICLAAAVFIFYLINKFI
jgi:undecaprenyl-diphosphatase